jgi:hypothetical protein
VRPFLLAAGLALTWFALFQDANVEGDLPSWGLLAVLGSRFAVDLVYAWLAVTLLRFGLLLVRLGWVQLRRPRG